MNVNPLHVACQPSMDGWSCEVRIGDDAGATHHAVTVPAAELDRLQPGASDPTELVTAAFRFLLTREPREAILRAFDLPVIGRYFPGWDTEVGDALGREPGG